MNPHSCFNIGYNIREMPLSYQRGLDIILRYPLICTSTEKVSAMLISTTVFFIRSQLVGYQQMCPCICCGKPAAFSQQII